MKTLWIEDDDALNVGRVIVTKTGTKDCVVCYSYDEIDDHENRLKADMVAMLTDIQLEFEEGLRCKGCCNNCVNACEDIPAGWFLDFIDAKINSLKENTDG